MKICPVNGRMHTTSKPKLNKFVYNLIIYTKGKFMGNVKKDIWLMLLK